MRKPITIFTGGSGLYTREDPVKLDFNPETGISDLAVAVNVVISDKNRVSRRGGSTLVNSTVYHSTFSLNRLEFLGVAGTSLRKVSVSDFSYTELTTVTEGARVFYVKVGNAVLFANGYELGIITDGEYEEWVKGTYYGPDTPRSRTLIGPPKGTLLCYYANSVLIADGNVLWCSEPNSLNLFSSSDGYLFYGSNITMLAPVSTGIYLSTENRVIYLGGDTFKKFSENPLTDYPAIKGTNVATSGLLLPKPFRNPELVNVFTTTEGICVGGSDKVFGTILFDNLTRDRFDYPSGLEGSATIIDNVYVVNIYK